MPDLSFRIEGVQVVPYAVSPLLAFDLHVANSTSEPIHTVVLRCQVQIEAVRRRYSAAEQERMGDLFGEPHRWGQTLRTMLWTQTSIVVPGFTGAAQIELPVSCTFDFNVATVKYFAGLEEGDIPLCFQFSGTVFYEPAQGEPSPGALQVAPISWDREAKFRLPVRTWREMMDRYYPNSAWLCLSREVFDRLRQRKAQMGAPTWERMFEALLEEITQGVAS